MQEFIWPVSKIRVQLEEYRNYGKEQKSEVKIADAEIRASY
jgi:hypothetical protein